VAAHSTREAQPPRCSAAHVRSRLVSTERLDTSLYVLVRSASIRHVGIVQHARRATSLLVSTPKLAGSRARSSARLSSLASNSLRVLRNGSRPSPTLTGVIVVLEC
jgi:hypothetical protein